MMNELSQYWIVSGPDGIDAYRSEAEAKAAAEELLEPNGEWQEGTEAVHYGRVTVLGQAEEVNRRDDPSGDFDHLCEYVLRGAMRREFARHEHGGVHFHVEIDDEILSCEASLDAENFCVWISGNILNCIDYALREFTRCYLDLNGFRDGDARPFDEVLAALQKPASHSTR